jgi:hypothetical protein
MLRYHWLLVMFALLGGVYLTAVACSDDDAQTGPNQPGTLPSPSQGGSVPQGATITFEGTQYTVVAVSMSDTDSGEIDEFHEAGIAEDASFSTEGELKVYKRDNDESAIYTRSEQPAQGGSETKLLYRWQPSDKVNELAEPTAPATEGATP